jgi:hypothetical protein
MLTERGVKEMTEQRLQEDKSNFSFCVSFLPDGKFKGFVSHSIVGAPPTTTTHHEAGIFNTETRAVNAARTLCLRLIEEHNSDQ